MRVLEEKTITFGLHYTSGNRSHLQFFLTLADETYGYGNISRQSLVASHRYGTLESLPKSLQQLLIHLTKEDIQANFGIQVTTSLIATFLYISLSLPLCFLIRWSVIFKIRTIII